MGAGPLVIENASVSNMEEYSSPAASYFLLSDTPSHQNIYSELMPVPSGDCYPPMYLPATPPLEAHNSSLKMEMGRIGTIREHKILGKRKNNYTRELSDFDDESGADDKSVRTNDDKKQNHSEIEKRRRDKMNTYITELATMIPMCHANPRKLDKLTVLRMAVQHLRSIRGAVHSYTEGHYKPSFLSDEELKHLILEAAEGFLFVVGCDRGRILFVSESVSDTLHFSQGDLLGQSWFDYMHPKDVAKVKEQLSPSDLNPRERFIDSKTMLPVKTDVPIGATRLGPGSRRSFLCRMKCRQSVQVKEEADTTTGSHRPRKKNASADKRYCVVQCTGYMKSWAPAKMGIEEAEAEGDSEGCNLSCLVAVGRLQGHPAARPTTTTVPKSRPIEFVSRHNLDGTFLFVDQRVCSVLGFLPQELLGTSMYEYFHQEDIRHLSETHRLALQNLEIGKTQSYRFRIKDGGYVTLHSEWRPFKNPWTKDVEYIIAKNIALPSDVLTADSSAVRPDGATQSGGSYQFLSQGSGIGGIQRIVTSHAEASLIGQQIAKETARRQGGSPTTSGTSSPGVVADNDSSLPLPSIESPMSTSGLEDGQTASLQRLNANGLTKNEWQCYTSAVRNNVPLSITAVSDVGGSDPDPEMIDMMGESVLPHSPQAGGSEGNDEAAMAVIMSLLEADAGLGGPVDFSGLPWPLP